MENIEFKSIDHDDISQVLSDIQTYTNNDRLNMNQYFKYMSKHHPIELWYGAFVDGRCVALALLQKFNYLPGIILLAEIQTVIKGYGKPLIENILSRCNNIWWCADPDSGEKLVEYYKQFGLKEYLIQKSKWTNTPEYAFYKADAKHETMIIDNLKKADLKKIGID